MGTPCSNIDGWVGSYSPPEWGKQGEKERVFCFLWPCIRKVLIFLSEAEIFFPAVLLFFVKFRKFYTFTLFFSDFCLGNNFGFLFYT